MTLDLIHFHKPSEDIGGQAARMPSCCAHKLGQIVDERERAADRRRRDAVDAERRRVILDSIRSVERYWASALSVLPADPATELAGKVVAGCIETVRAAGCICPDVDVSMLGEGSDRTVKGRDSRCGVHKRGDL